MSQTCTRCSRSNPQDATFCYFDGAPLGRGASAALDTGKQRFPMPFVFPSGKQCSSFDELATCCWNNWDQAVDALQRGYVDAFLNGLGRRDLALAAQQAARFPDRSRGLDQFIGQLPTNVLAPATLEVNTTDLQLGEIRVGEDRTVELTIRNQGMRLLHGTISCASGVWLGIGQGAGVQNKMFACTDELVVQLRIRGKHLRASKQPLEDQLVIESNGGNETVRVRVHVPVTPYPSGALAGASTPRQIAEKAKAQPREAAALFEKGAVEKWYRTNGWEYPVKVQGATGIASVQQFFEALGLTAPPKVSIRPTSLQFQGGVGEHIEENLEVTTAEKRAVWAVAHADQPWLQAYKASEGKGATIRVQISSVPDCEGETIRGTITVTSNGNQRFKVPVSLTAGPGTVSDASQKRKKAAVVIAADKAAVYGARSRPSERATSPATADEGAFNSPAAPARGKKNGSPIMRFLHLWPIAFILLGLLVPLIHDMPVVYHALKAATDGSSAVAGGGSGSPPAGVEDDKLDPDPKIKIIFQEKAGVHGDLYVTKGSGGGIKGSGTGDAPPPDTDFYVEDPTARFGIVSLLEKDPGPPDPKFDVVNPDRWKRLTYHADGWTNNTCIRLDGKESLFGIRPMYNKKSSGELLPIPGYQWAGIWKSRDWNSAESRQSELGKDKEGNKRIGYRSVWVYPDENIEITQIVKLVRGGRSWKLDTCRVEYIIENKDKNSHKVGLRFLLDTFIGTTDGVPFTIPTEKSGDLCDKMREFNGKDSVPDFIQVLENEDLTNPGTVAQLQFKQLGKDADLGKELESADKVTLGTWPNHLIPPGAPLFQDQWTMWNVPVQSMKRIHEVDPRNPPDSCVVMYWDERELAAGETRLVGFKYGLGNVASQGGKLGLDVVGSFWTGGELTATAYVSRPEPGQTVTLVLPDGFKLLSDSDTQPVPPVDPDAARHYSVVTWRLRAPDRKGKFDLKVKSSTGGSEVYPVEIKGGRIFE